MAQHDMNIANQGFPAFRSDLNNALSAIQTNHSGTSRPSGAVAGQIWLDTTSATNPTLKFFDGTDDISLATIDYSANTVNWLDSTVSVTGLATTATGTVLTLSDTATTQTVNFIIDNEKEIRFSEADGNGSNYVALKAPASLASDVTFTLPSADGTADQVLKTDGSGNLSFVDATGGIDWCTTAKTAPFTGVSGKGYFVNTTCGAVTVTLPATPTAGDVVAFKDYAGQWNTNSVTLCNNGNKINGDCATADLNTQNQSVTLIYVDATKGWQDINDSTAGVSGGDFITATGGTITTSGDYKIHTFTSDGTFCVSAGSGSKAEVSYMVVAGGGGSGGDGAGAGGAGGFREGKVSGDPYTASPLAASGLPVSAQSYPITVGAGGSGVGQPVACGNSGSNSVFSTTISAGGGAGNRTSGTPGGSGGGAGRSSPVGVGGTGNTPPVSPPQGNNGGDSPSPLSATGGGGGATTAGTDVTSTGVGGPGGTGAATGIAPASYGELSCGSYYFAGGGGGGTADSPHSPGAGGLGGGGCGATGPTPAPNNPGSAGTANTGGGGGGSSGSGPATGFAGGSGIVVIRYKFQ